MEHMCITEESPATPRTQEEHEAVTMANKRANIKKLSDASLGKFDADQSRVAYLAPRRIMLLAREDSRGASHSFVLVYI